MSSPHSTLSQELYSDRTSAFRVENPSGNAFNLLWDGPYATNVPKEAIIVDSTSPEIFFSNPSDPTVWNSISSSPQHYRSSLWYTTRPGASLSFSFDGVAIWYDCVPYNYNVHADLFLRYYGFVAKFNGFYTISIDGSGPEQLDGRQDNKGEMGQQMLWSKTDLTPGSHIFTLRKDDVNGTWMSLDFFRSVTSEVTVQYLTLPLSHHFRLWFYSVLRSGDASALHSSTPTSTGATTPGAKSNVVPLAVGLTLGLTLSVLAVLTVFCLRRRRGRKPAAPKKGDQLSGAPQESNHPQPTQLPASGPSLPSSVPTATAVPDPV